MVLMGPRMRLGGTGMGQYWAAMERTIVGIRGPHPSMQHSTASSWGLGACSQLHLAPGEGNQKRRCMAAVTATQVTWGRMEVIIELSSGHNLPQS